MLRVTTHNKESLITIVVEGRLALPWIQELECCWKGLTLKADQLVLVNLESVTFIDFKGKELLTKMFQQGASFIAKGLMTKAILDEIQFQASR